MINPGKLQKPLYIYIGGTWNPVLRLTSVSQFGPAIDLTGYEAEIQIRTSLAAKNPIVTLSTGIGGGITIPTPTDGKIYPLILPDDTALYSPTPQGVLAVMDLKLTAPDPTIVEYWLQADIIIQQMVTRS